MPTDESPSELDRDTFIKTRQKLEWVGIALICVAVLGGITNMSLAMALNAFQNQGPKVQAPANMSRDEKEQFERGRDAAPGMQACGFLFISLIYIPVFLGGRRLYLGRDRKLGVTAAVISMLPCSPAFIIGLPIGIWTLMVLGQPEVIKTLERRRRKRRRKSRDEVAGEAHGEAADE